MCNTSQTVCIAVLQHTSGCSCLHTQYGGCCLLSVTQCPWRPPQHQPFPAYLLLGLLVYPTPAECGCAEAAGIVGFDTDMGATKLGKQGDATSGTIATVRVGMQEIEQRWSQPFRHSLWKYLLPVCIIPCAALHHTLHYSIIRLISTTEAALNQCSGIMLPVDSAVALSLFV